MKNVKILSLGIAMLLSLLSFSQQKKITGIVTYNLGPLPGANVSVKGTRINATTDFDGKYAISAKVGDILVFSFVEFNTEQRVVSTANVINVVMKMNSNQLNEVIVGSYGIKKNKKTATSSYQTVTSKNLQVLQGKVSGISISKNSAPASVRDYDEEKDDSNKFDTKLGYISNEKTDEEYNSLIENPFESPTNAPLSTFSIDVDNASYTNIRRFINNGQKVPKDAVRVEEMMNFFKYSYPQPTDSNPFSISTEYSECPWNTNHQLLKIGLQGKDIEPKNLPLSNLVFLIDVSGSMSDNNKLPLLIQSFKVLVGQLRDNDKVSIVVYAGAAGLVLPPTFGKEKNKIIDALEKLQSGGSTAGGAGIELAYKTAQENFIKDGNNRVILATDGDFNVGISSNSSLESLVEEKRKTGVFLTCLGFGMGNYKDTKMEILADKGNGNYAYIDNIQEANRFLGKEFKGSIFTIAKDVKIQIEFNPSKVLAYRLIGYENRKLRPEDFKNDAIDAGELGSNHTVTALYEVIPANAKSDYFLETDALKYTKTTTSPTNFSNELATIKFRYKKPAGEQSIEMINVIQNISRPETSTSSDFKFSAAVAWFGLKLRDSKLLQNKSEEAILALANEGIANDKDGYKAEFVRLVEAVN